MKTALVLAPHTDDGEFGCGATMAKLADEGWWVEYIAFSTGTANAMEMTEANKILGSKDSTVFNGNSIITRLFANDRQRILDRIIQVRDTIKPDLVFIPCSQDTHQDHQVIHEEAKRAFKHCSLLGYELPWNHSQFFAGMFYKISLDNLMKKHDAICCYESQKDRNYSSYEFISGLACVRGTQINEKYAEAFEVIRWIQS